ncbi:hypothetical protein JTB14_024665 [Gonioctena quinquepunctata]|nr:hypothetical protein JTB14_024665 [Gonioctena quinquepunctata]
MGVGLSKSSESFGTKKSIASQKLHDAAIIKHHGFKIFQVDWDPPDPGGRCLFSLIIAITETWLTTDMPSASFKIHGYDLYRKDWPTRGGGITFCVSTRIDELVIGINTTCIEPLWLKGKMNGKSHELCAFYRPPVSNINVNHIFEYIMKADLKMIKSKSENYNLKLNESHTMLTLFGNKIVRQLKNNIELKIDCTPISHKKTISSLGLLIDDDLKF